MMYWSNDWGWGGWLLMTVSMLAFWGLVAWVAVTIIRSVGAPTRGRDTDPESILAERFARGDIDEDEYRHRMEVLRARH